MAYALLETPAPAVAGAYARTPETTRTMMVTQEIRRHVRMLGAAMAAAVPLTLAGCASTPERIILEPGVQIGDATVDVVSGSVSAEQEGVVVTAQAAMLPAPRSSTLRPTFWVTVQNTRDERISLTPADARLVDSFGNQLAPVPMSIGGRGQDLSYALVDPEIHTYVSLHYGWPYYPLYPYRGWFAHPRFSRLRYWHYDPFWTLGVGPIWIREIGPPRAIGEPTAYDPEREEIIYRDAQITYVVVFPQVERLAKNLRLIVPGVRVSTETQQDQALEFEMVFEQILDARLP